MGIPSSGADDLAAAKATGSFTATGSGSSVSLKGNLNISLWGTFAGTVIPERSFDGGTTWIAVAFSDGTTISFTAPFSATWQEPERGVLYRVRCSAFTSGTINWRLSQ